MTAFNPITPMGAIAFVETAGVPDARRLISDHAAAGTIRTYAMVIETTPPGEAPTVVRGASLPAALWQRIVREGSVADVWLGGTVRLSGSDLVDGPPAVDITGIGFNELSLRTLVAHHRAGKVAAWEPPLPAAPPSQPEAEPPTARASAAKRTKPEAPSIAPGAILATVQQAMAALGVGRTKVNEMMSDGRLKRLKVDGSTRITVASIRAVASGT